MELVEIVLAAGLTTRATRLVVIDQAGHPVRSVLLRSARLIGTRAQDLVDDLLACPYCAGWWIAVLVAGSWALWGSTIGWTAVALAATISQAAGMVLARDASW
jgi:hypothetical protein